MGFTNPFQNAVDQNYTTGFGAGSNCYTDDGLTFYSSVAGAVINTYVNASGVVYDLYFNATTADQGPITLSGGLYNWSQSIRSNTPAVLGYANVKAYGATGDGVTNDTAAFTAARAAHSILYVPDGTYVLLNFALTSNTTIICQSWNTIFLQIPNAVGGQFVMGVNIGTGGSNDPSTNIRNITIKNGQFQGRIGAEAFFEQAHLLGLSAASFVTIENCYFYKWKGDAIYIGSSTSGGAERHNENIYIKNCWFDGFNQDNRNSISVIDGTGIYITDSLFERCTRSGMPGAIDLEPDVNFRYYRIRDVFIERNTFKNMSTTSTCVAITLFADVGNPTIPYSNIQVRGNKFLTSNSFGTYIFYKITGGVTDSDTRLDILFEDNVFDGCLTPIFLAGCKGATFFKNIFKNYTAAIAVGNGDAINLQDILFADNRFLPGITTNNSIINIKSSSKNIEFRNNEFIDVGKSDFSQGFPVIFSPSSSITMTAFKFNNNKITSPTNRTTQAFASFGTTLFIDCDFQTNYIKVPLGFVIYGRGARVTAIPASGTFIQGDNLINSTPIEQGAATTKYVVFGWVRVTSGAANVLGTDWMPQRALTGN